MKEYMNTKAAADAWGISMRRINLLCQQGRIEGAYKEGRAWLIPREASKPTDQRLKKVYVESVVKNKQKVTYTTYDQLVPKGLLAREGFVEYSTPKKPLAIGRTSYKDVVTRGYYVDKTLLIRDIIDTFTQLALFTRPRRFGKTLNMDMLRTFFEISKEDTAKYFKDTKIWACGERYRKEQGRYPVIWFSFKDVKCATWEETLAYMGKLIQTEYKRHSEIAESLSTYDRAYYEKIVGGQGNSVDLMYSLKALSQMLHEHYGVAPVILIDEYDIPVLSGYKQGFYDDIFSFVRNFLSGGLKDNAHVSYGFMTGILSIAKESVFSGLNNVREYTVLDERFSQYFGFTAEEVRQMAKYYEAEDRYQEICAYYDGYHFGKTEIFNPWSVLNYFDNQFKAQVYWANTSSNDVLGEVLDHLDMYTTEQLQALMEGKRVLVSVNVNTTYQNINDCPDNIFSFLLMSGYLKIASRDDGQFGNYFCELTIPNMEIREVFKREILQKINEYISVSTANEIWKAIRMNKVGDLQLYLNNFLMQSVSYYDTANESFYHGLVLGLCALLDSGYRVTSNRESGKGRYDIQMLPKRQGLPGIIMEIKAGKESSDEALTALAQAALEQIKSKEYQAELQAQNVTPILYYGMAFCGKEAKILVEQVASTSIHKKNC